MQTPYVVVSAVATPLLLVGLLRGDHRVASGAPPWWCLPDRCGARRGVARELGRRHAYGVDEVVPVLRTGQGEAIRPRIARVRGRI